MHFIQTVLSSFPIILCIISNKFEFVAPSMCCHSLDPSIEIFHIFIIIVLAFTVYQFNYFWILYGILNIFFTMLCGVFIV